MWLPELKSLLSLEKTLNQVLRRNPSGVTNRKLPEGNETFPPKSYNFIIFVRIANSNMNSKLTLKLESAVIERAKKYARLNKTSLSKMIENYLESLTKEMKDSNGITPLVDSLTGSIKIGEGDYKKEYIDFLSEKYK